MPMFAPGIGVVSGSDPVTVDILQFTGSLVSVSQSDDTMVVRVGPQAGSGSWQASLGTTYPLDPGWNPDATSSPVYMENSGTSPFFTSSFWFFDAAKTTPYKSWEIISGSNIFPSVEQWVFYDVSGNYVGGFYDDIKYQSNVFEVERTRSLGIVQPRITSVTPSASLFVGGDVVVGGYHIYPSSSITVSGSPEVPVTAVSYSLAHNSVTALNLPVYSTASSINTVVLKLTAPDSKVASATGTWENAGWGSPDLYQQSGLTKSVTVRGPDSVFASQGSGTANVGLTGTQLVWSYSGRIDNPVPAVGFQLQGRVSVYGSYNMLTGVLQPNTNLPGWTWAYNENTWTAGIASADQQWGTNHQLNFGFRKSGDPTKGASFNLHGNGFVDVGYDTGVETATTGGYWAGTYSIIIDANKFYMIANGAVRLTGSTSGLLATSSSLFSDQFFNWQMGPANIYNPVIVSILGQTTYSGGDRYYKMSMSFNP